LSRNEHWKKKARRCENRAWNPVSEALPHLLRLVEQGNDEQSMSAVLVLEDLEAEPEEVLSLLMKRAEKLGSDGACLVIAP